MSRGGRLPAVGEILRGTYELIRTLGEGGMAVVFEGRHKETHERVAIKVLAPELSRDAEIVARFEREARAVGRLRTRHVAHVVEVAATDEGVPFIVMDFLDGRDMASELEARGSLPIEEAVDYILQTCAAMDEAHRSGIVHRDLKPANLFLTHEAGTLPEERIVKVLDFGISKLIGESSKLTGAGAVMGTVVYMSPEQVRSSSDVDQRADVWSLGVILFELLCGRAPFEGPGHKIAIAIVSDTAPSVQVFAPNVPNALAETIARMLRREREDRYGSIREAAIALVPFAQEGSVGARVLPELGKDLPPRGRAATAGKTMPLIKRTIPLGHSPNFSHLANANQNPSAYSNDAAPSSSPTPSQLHAQTLKVDRSNQRKRSSDTNARLATIGGAIGGLIAAAVVVYVGLLIMQRPITTPSSTSSPPPSATSLPIPAPSTATSPEAPQPPSSSPSAATSASAGSKGPLSSKHDAGAPTTTTSSDLGNPLRL